MELQEKEFDGMDVGTIFTARLNADDVDDWYMLDVSNPVRSLVFQDREPLEKDLPERYIDALNTRLPDEMIKLYIDSGVHVSAARTIRGMEALRTWYAQLFVQILPNATFTLAGFSGSGSSRHLTWTAISSSGRVLNGNDTFGLIGKKIAYHYTFFTVTS